MSLLSPRIRRLARSCRSRAALRDLRVDPLVSYAMILLESHTARVPIASTRSFPQVVDGTQVAFGDLVNGHPSTVNGKPGLWQSTVDR